MKRFVPVVLAVAAIGALTLCIWAFSRSFFGTGNQAVAATMHYKCEACGNEWDGPSAAKPVCPKCHAVAISTTKYRCPQCGKGIVAVETQKLGPGQFRYRLAGSKEWLERPPAEITCPECGFKSGTFYLNGANARPRPAAEKD